MTIRNPRAPLSMITAFEQSAAQRALSIRAFKARLKLVAWITVPYESIKAVPEYGLALFPVHPHARWTWQCGNGQVYLSKALIWFGFWRDTYPEAALIL